MCPAGTPGTVRTEEELIEECRENFYLTATAQGRLSYLVMSIHAVNPDLILSVTDYDPTHFLFSNMLYGMGVHLYARPSMIILSFFHRSTFSFLGSAMFNYTSMQVYGWLKERFSHRPYLLTFLGFLSGRLMMIHLLAYLYHVDTRSMTVGPILRRDSAYETMYM